jgi:small subunit ribosomal protein S7
MPRRRRAPKKPIAPDPRYNSVEIGRFIGRLMKRGKKSLALRILYEAFDLIEKESKQDPVQVMSQAMQNVTPLLSVKPRRVGGATYQVPLEVPPNHGEALASRWILAAARARKAMPMGRRLALELMDAAKREGTAVKRREDLHRMAEANRAFAHYKW